MSQVDVWVAPSRAELMQAALLAALQSGLVGWTVRRRANLGGLRDLLVGGDAMPLCVQLRGPRRLTGAEPVKGTTARLWAVQVPLAVVVFEVVEDARPAALDAAEVKIANVVKALSVSVDFGALARTVDLDSFEPATIEAEGDAPPHAASVATVIATVYE